MTLATGPRGPLTFALSLRDAYTQHHCGRVEFWCVELGRRCGLSEPEIRVLRDAARLHDVGKIGIPDSILFKPGRLDAQEWEVMKTHAAAGALICQRLAMPDAEAIALLVRHHHERFDGTGYPDGLAGDAIPLGARIIGVVDGYDAMTSTRPYHAARSHDQVMEIMRGERGRKTDPLVFDRFAGMIVEDAHDWQRPRAAAAG